MADRTQEFIQQLQLFYRQLTLSITDSALIIKSYDFANPASLQTLSRFPTLLSEFYIFWKDEHEYNQSLTTVQTVTPTLTSILDILFYALNTVYSNYPEKHPLTRGKDATNKTTTITTQHTQYILYISQTLWYSLQLISTLLHFGIGIVLPDLNSLNDNDELSIHTDLRLGASMQTVDLYTMYTTKLIHILSSHSKLIVDGFWKLDSEMVYQIHKSSIELLNKLFIAISKYYTTTLMQASQIGHFIINTPLRAFVWNTSRYLYATDDDVVPTKETMQMSYLLGLVSIKDKDFMIPTTIENFDFNSPLYNINDPQVDFIPQSIIETGVLDHLWTPDEDEISTSMDGNEKQLFADKNDLQFLTHPATPSQYPKFVAATLYQTPFSTKLGQLVQDKTALDASFLSASTNTTSSSTTSTPLLGPSTAFGFERSERSERRERGDRGGDRSGDRGVDRGGDRGGGSDKNNPQIVPCSFFHYPAYNFDKFTIPRVSSPGGKKPCLPIELSPMFRLFDALAVATIQKQTEGWESWTAETLHIGTLFLSLLTNWIHSLTSTQSFLLDPTQLISMCNKYVIHIHYNIIHLDDLGTQHWIDNQENVKIFVQQVLQYSQVITWYSTWYYYYYSLKPSVDPCFPTAANPTHIASHWREIMQPKDGKDKDMDEISTPNKPGPKKGSGAKGRKGKNMNDDDDSDEAPSTSKGGRGNKNQNATTDLNSFDEHGALTISAVQTVSQRISIVSKRIPLFEALNEQYMKTVSNYQQYFNKHDRFTIDRVSNPDYQATVQAYFRIIKSIFPFPDLFELFINLFYRLDIDPNRPEYQILQQHIMLPIYLFLHHPTIRPYAGFGMEDCETNQTQNGQGLGAFRGARITIQHHYSRHRITKPPYPIYPIAPYSHIDTTLSKTTKSKEARERTAGAGGDDDRTDKDRERNRNYEADNDKLSNIYPVIDYNVDFVNESKLVYVSKGFDDSFTKVPFEYSSTAQSFKQVLNQVEGLNNDELLWKYCRKLTKEEQLDRYLQFTLAHHRAAIESIPVPSFNELIRLSEREIINIVLLYREKILREKSKEILKKASLQNNARVGTVLVKPNDEESNYDDDSDGYSANSKRGGVPGNRNRRKDESNDLAFRGKKTKSQGNTPPTRTGTRTRNRPRYVEEEEDDDQNDDDDDGEGDEDDEDEDEELSQADSNDGDRNKTTHGRSTSAAASRNTRGKKI